MKKVLIVMLVLFIATLSQTVSARSHHHNWSNPSFHSDTWHQVSRDNDSFDGSGPYHWYENRNRFSSYDYRMERIHDREWNHRFPGLHSYRWHDRHGQGFWYHGRHITDAVFFYNNSDELVSVGFMQDGVFIHIRDDHSSYENHDSFFLSWQHW